MAGKHKCKICGRMIEHVSYDGRTIRVQKHTRPDTSKVCCLSGVVVGRYKKPAKADFVVS